MRDTPMPPSQPAETRRKPCFFPLLLSLALVLLIAAVLFIFHTEERGGDGTEDSPAEAAIAQAERRRDALLREKQRLERLLALPPCEARSGAAAEDPA